MDYKLVQWPGPTDRLPELLFNRDPNQNSGVTLNQCICLSHKILKISTYCIQGKVKDKSDIVFILIKLLHMD